MSKVYGGELPRPLLVIYVLIQRDFGQVLMLQTIALFPGPRLLSDYLEAAV